jgi:hypothetical protein
LRAFHVYWKLIANHFCFVFAEPNWGLPLAIAANLHIPYRIEIGIDVENVNIKDRAGKGKAIKLLDTQMSTLPRHYFRQFVNLRLENFATEFPDVPCHFFAPRILTGNHALPTLFQLQLKF